VPLLPRAPVHGVRQRVGAPARRPLLRGSGGGTVVSRRRNRQLHWLHGGGEWRDTPVRAGVTAEGGGREGRWSTVCQRRSVARIAALQTQGKTFVLCPSCRQAVTHYNGHGCHSMSCVCGEGFVSCAIPPQQHARRGATWRSYIVLAARPCPVGCLPCCPLTQCYECGQVEHPSPSTCSSSCEGRCLVCPPCPMCLECANAACRHFSLPP